MLIDISGFNCGHIHAEKLKTHIEEHIKREVTKYFKNAVSSHIHIKNESSIFEVTITVNPGSSLNKNFDAEARAENPYVAFDQALDKLGTQLRRYKDKLSNHHQADGVKIKETTIKESTEENVA